MADHVTSVFELKYFVVFFIFIVAVKSQLSPDQNCANRPQLSVLPEHCCAIPPFFDDAILAGCKNAQGNDAAVRPDAGRKKRFATSRIELGTCYLACVFQYSGVTSANGQVLDTNKLLQTLVSKTPTEQITNNAITSAVTQCINDMNSGQLRIRSPTVYNCSTVPSAILMCIHRKFFLNCPAQRFANNQPCVTLRDYLTRCPVTI